MPYLGNNLSVQQYTPQIVYFAGDGTTTTFTLPTAVASATQVVVSVNNVVQNPFYAFTLVGTTLTFTSPPPANSTTPNNIWVEYINLQVNTIQPGQGTVTPNTLSNGGPYWSPTGNVGIGTLYPVVSLDLSQRTDALALPVGTTAQRPANPIGGMMRKNTTTGYVEYYDTITNQWLGIGQFAAIGGTIYKNVNGYNYHVFTTSGTFTVETGSKTANILIVAGGGSGGGQGGNDAGAGGGAGGLVYTTTSIFPGTYTVIIGGGGSGVGYDTNGNSGSNSSFTGLTTAIGGGFGSAENSGSRTGGSGGSGGGGGGYSGSNGSGTPGQGNNGAPAGGASYGGGGGGGAGSAGSNETGGNGLQYSAMASATGTGANGGYYAGGGGGGGDQRSTTTGGNGGLGGGGIGSNATSGSVATSGLANTGGGGGGQSGLNYTGTHNSGNGGSGIVIVQYSYP